MVPRPGGQDSDPDGKVAAVGSHHLRPRRGEGGGESERRKLCALTLVVTFAPALHTLRAGSSLLFVFYQVGSGSLAIKASEATGLQRLFCLQIGHKFGVEHYSV